MRGHSAPIDMTKQRVEPKSRVPSARVDEKTRRRSLAQAIRLLALYFGRPNGSVTQLRGRSCVPKSLRRGRCRADRVAAMRDLQRP